MSSLLIRSATSQSGSYPIVLTTLGGPSSRPNPHLKFVEVPGINTCTWIKCFIIKKWNCGRFTLVTLVSVDMPVLQPVWRLGSSMWCLHMAVCLILVAEPGPGYLCWRTFNLCNKGFCACPCARQNVMSSVVHGIKVCGQKIFMPVWWCHQLQSGFLAKGYLPRMPLQLRLSADDRVISGTVHRSPGICLTAEENTGNPPPGDRRWWLWDQSSPQMGSPT